MQYVKIPHKHYFNIHIYNILKKSICHVIRSEFALHHFVHFPSDDNIQYSNLDHGGLRRPIWDTKEVELLLKLVKNNYSRLNASSTIQVWKEITSEIAKSVSAIPLSPLLKFHFPLVLMFA